MDNGIRFAVRRIIAAVLLFGVLTATACSTASELPQGLRAGATASDGAASDAPPTLSSTVRGPSGAVLAPAPPDAKPAVTADDAEDVFLKSGLHPDLVKTRAAHETLLVEYTNTVAGDIQSDGSVQHPYANVLVWALIFRDVQPLILGPAGPPDSTPATSDLPAEAEFVFLVDATSGADLGGFENSMAAMSS